jgi:hypothetical protein
MKLLNLYVIHSEYLKNRVKYLNVTIDMIKKLAEEQNLRVNINLVKEPTKEYIEEHVEEFNKKVKYEKEEGIYADEQFNNSINVLNVHQISNLEKHRLVLTTISNKQKPDELHFIIEDDVLVGEDYIHNIKALFKALQEDRLTEWDILFTGQADMEKNEQISLQDSRKNYKFLLCKSSYFIRPATAKKLAAYLEVYKYTLKNAISKFVWDNKDLKSCITNKHTFLEGSKMGLFTTSVNNSNFLYQNSQFVSLAKITTNDEITDEMLKEAEDTYKSLQQFENPDILHTMGVIYYKRKDYSNAKKYMTEACDKMQSGFAYISKSSEILNNAINIYQYEQAQLEECKKKISKYNVDSVRVY